MKNSGNEMRSKLFALVLLSLMSVAFLSACESKAEADLAYEETTVRRIGVVLDGTGSTNISFAETAKAAIIDALRMEASPDEKALKDGAPAAPGTHMWLFRVTDNANAYEDARYLLIDIPAVPGLPPRPEIDLEGDEDAMEDYAKWSKLRDGWIEMRNEAAAKAAAAAAAVESFELQGSNSSGIFNTLDAMIANFEGERGIHLLICSDLIENVGRAASSPSAGGGIASDWDCTAIVAIPDGAPDAAQARFEALKTLLAGYGMPSDAITMYRPEDLSGKVRAFFADAS